MLVDRCDERLLGGADEVPHDVAGGGRLSQRLLATSSYAACASAYCEEQYEHLASGIRRRVQRSKIFCQVL